MPSLADIALLLQGSETLHDLTIRQINTFFITCRRLWRQIQDDNKVLGRTRSPLTLRPEIQNVLSSLMGLPMSIVLDAWNVLHHMVMEVDLQEPVLEPNTLASHNLRALTIHSMLVTVTHPSYGIVAMKILEPSSETCTTPACHQAKLSRRPPMQATLFTLHDGIVPVMCTALYCHSTFRIRPSHSMT